VVCLVPLMRMEKPDWELKERVLRGETMKGWDQGPESLSARKATTSVGVSDCQILDMRETYCSVCNRSCGS
jgi:hypothetical protein